MATTDNHPDTGKQVLVAIQLAGKDMRLQVVDGNQWNIQRQAEGLGSHQANQQGASQARLGSHGNCIQFCQRQAGLPQCLVYDRQDALDMRAGSNFRDNAAKPLVQCQLGCHHRAEHLQLVVQHRGCGFITG